MSEPSKEKYGNAIVRFYQGANVRGTGFRVKGRYIMTCAHVVSQCLGLGKDPDKVEAEKVQGKSLEINFACEGKDAPKLKVDIIPELWRWEGEDIAIVCLEEDPPNSIEIEISTEPQQYLDHQFYVYGFPDGHGETGLIARGKMLGELSVNRRIQVQGDTAQGSSIRPGYSGAPVWDCTIGGVRGMAVASVKEEEEALETEKVKIGFIIPADKLSRAVEVVKLFELLLPYQEQFARHWKDAYKWAEPPGMSSIGGTGFPKDLKQAIVQLFQLPTAWGKFIAYLIVVLQDLEQYIALEQWLKSQVSDQDYKHLIDNANAEYNKLKAAKANTVQVQTSHLLFCIESELNQPDYTIKAYFVPDAADYDAQEPPSGFIPVILESFIQTFQSDRLNKEQVKQVLQECLKQMGKICKTELRVEIFLTESDCNWDVDLWEVIKDGSTLMGCKYDLVLRLENRWKTHSAFIPDWQKRWNYLTDQSISQQVMWVCGDGKKRNKIIQAFKELDQQNRYAAGLLFSEELPSARAFQGALEAGVPVILWSRKTIPGCQTVQEICANNHLNLRQRINEQREQGHEQWDEGDGEDHIGRHLGLIWDDINLVPPGVLDPVNLAVN